MKHFYLPVFLVLTLITCAPFLMLAQQTATTKRHMLRIYEDNDFINILGKGTDEAYTNGTRIDYFYISTPAKHSLPERLLPKAGRYAVNIHGWGITQLMFTPRDISIAQYQHNDYPYSGALFLTHSLNSYNPVKKYSLQTELAGGVRGPASLAGPTQKLIHHIINYQQPMGWDNQLKNKIILNISLTAEKQVYAYGSMVEVIGGAQILTGSFNNSVILYPLIRMGKMKPYFDGLISQYSTTPGHAARSKKYVQAYFIIKPAMIVSAGNGLLQAGQQQFSEDGKTEYPEKIKKAIYIFNAGAVLSINRLSISFTQNIISAMMPHLYNHEVGNISLYVTW